MSVAGRDEKDNEVENFYRKRHIKKYYKAIAEIIEDSITIDSCKYMIIKKLIKLIYSPTQKGELRRYKLTSTNGEHFTIVGTYKEVTKIGKKYMQDNPFTDIRIFSIGEQLK